MGGAPNQKKSTGPTVVVPPDGGWGWMVVLGSFLIHVIADGITYSFGVLIQDLLITFNESKGKTSWIVSIMIAFTLGSGPIASAFTNRFGCRKTTMVGAVIASFGSFLSCFANSITTLFFTMGFVTGIGFGMMYCPAIIIVTVYFEKKRAFATGVAVCGAGIGTFIFAPFTSYLLDQYAWRGTFLIYSGIILNCAVCGALFRDPPTKLISEEQIVARDHYLSSSIILDAIVEEDDNENLPVPLSPPTICVSAPHSPEKHPINLTNGGGIETTSVDDVRWLRSKQQNKPAEESVENKYFAVASGGGPPTARSMSSMAGGHYERGAGHSSSFKSSTLRRRGISESGHQPTNSLLNRKDVFYPASVENLPEFRSNPDLYHSVTSLHRPPSILDEEHPATPERVEGLWDDIKVSLLQMADVEVLKDPVFLIFGVSNFLTSMGMNPPLIFLPHRAELMGIAGEAWLLSSFGIANTIGRLFIGYIADRRWANRLAIYNTCITLCGIGTVLSFLCYTFELLACYAAFFGLSLSAYISLTSVILVDLLGLDKLTNSFGWILLFEGVASLVGAPIAGCIADAYSPSYDQSFAFSGTVIAISGIMLFPLPWLQRRIKRKNATKVAKLSITQESSVKT